MDRTRARRPPSANTMPRAEERLRAWRPASVVNRRPARRPLAGSATRLPVQQVPNVLRHQDGVDHMDGAVVGRSIADDACTLTVVLAPAEYQLAPGHRGADFAALHRLDS